MNITEILQKKHIKCNKVFMLPKYVTVVKCLRMNYPITSLYNGLIRIHSIMWLAESSPFII